MLSYGLFKGDITAIFEQLSEKIKQLELPMAPRLCIIDPNRGRAKQINNTSWEEVFQEHGYDIILGQDNVNIGHTKMYEYFRVDPITGNPRFMFTNLCRGRGGPIWQLQRYSWDEWVNNRTKTERDIKEKPKQYNKDFPDICRYVAMEDLKFSSLVHGPQIIKTIQPGFRPYGKVVMGGMR